jgi:hypothetical protein
VDKYDPIPILHDSHNGEHSVIAHLPHFLLLVHTEALFNIPNEVNPRSSKTNVALSRPRVDTSARSAVLDDLDVSIGSPDAIEERIEHMGGVRMRFLNGFLDLIRVISWRDARVSITILINASGIADLSGEGRGHNS